MDHVAIMKRSWGLTQKILTGEKTIETRWYKARYTPWNKIKRGDTIYFKDSGEPVTVKAVVSKVEQYKDLDEEKANEILKMYSHKDLGTTDIIPAVREYTTNKRYCIVTHLRNPQAVKPFEIDKSGYGSMSAWLCTDNINKLKKRAS